LIKLNKPVIVEGKYDKITLENIIDANIIATDGFRIFKDKAKCRLIRKIAEEKGIIVITDSDSAGALIRAHIKNITGNINITNVYIPKILGKEKRKNAPSKEGTLGVEGMSADIIRKALEKSGVTLIESKERKREITKTDMFALGFSGCSSAKTKRQEFLKHLDLPENLSPNAMLDILNTFYSLDELREEVEKWQMQDMVKK